MKKHITIVSALLLFGTILIFTTFNNNQMKQKTDTKMNLSTETEVNYILKDYNGRIALFNENKEKPLKIYDVFTDSLPETDIELIRNGIYVSASELNNVLSDYLS